MTEITIKRSEIGKHSLFNSDDTPRCILGHVIHHFGGKPTIILSEEHKGMHPKNMPSRLEFLTYDGGRHYSAIFHSIAMASDRSDFDVAIAKLALNGIKVNLID